MICQVLLRHRWDTAFFIGMACLTYYGYVWCDVIMAPNLSSPLASWGWKSLDQPEESVWERYLPCSFFAWHSGFWLTSLCPSIVRYCLAVVVAPASLFPLVPLGYEWTLHLTMDGTFFSSVGVSIHPPAVLTRLFVWRSYVVSALGTSRHTSTCMGNGGKKRWVLKIKLL